VSENVLGRRGPLGHFRNSGGILFHFCRTTPPTASERGNTFSTCQLLLWRPSNWEVSRHVNIEKPETVIEGPTSNFEDDLPFQNIWVSSRRFDRLSTMLSYGHPIEKVEGTYSTRDESNLLDCKVASCQLQHLPNDFITTKVGSSIIDIVHL